MFRIAVTGGIACGKTHVGRCLCSRGIPVWEADEAAHALLEPGTGVFRAVVGAFGDSILDVHGNVDRSVLGRLVFSSADDRLRLNALVHPAVMAACDAWMSGEMENGVPTAAAVIPLLHEAGFERPWDLVVCVTCQPATQLQRMRERGWTGKDADARLDAQWPQDRKAGLADVVIVNEGPKALLDAQIDQMLSRIEER